MPKITSCLWEGHQETSGLATLASCDLKALSTHIHMHACTHPVPLCIPPFPFWGLHGSHTPSPPPTDCPPPG